MLTYHTPFPMGLRLLLLGFSLFPLWGSYDLLTGVRFNSYFNVFFLFILVMALGAFIVFAAFFCAGIFGITQTVTIDAANGTVTRQWRHILPRLHTETLPFIYVRDIELVTQSWSDGPDDYVLRLHPTDGDSFNIVKFTDRKAAAAEAAKIRSMIGLPAVT